MNVTNPLTPQCHSPVESPFRTVFGSENLKKEFVKFLQTIFFQLDETKVLERMDQILADPAKSDRQVYEELIASIDGMRRKLPSLYYQLKALSVLQKGMGGQSAELLKDFRPEEFQNYLEIYFRRYVKTIQKAAQLPLQGQIFAAADKAYEGTLKEKLEAGSLFSTYPYQVHIPLNDEDCFEPDMQPEKTHKPIGNEVPDGEIDLIACLGGLHHIPPERVDAFADSLCKKLKSGAVLLLRDHNVTDSNLWAIASVVHSFVNATNGVAWDVEKCEVREFHSTEHWTRFLESHGFTRISADNLVLEDDPTQNGMTAFVKTPENLAELQTASKYLKSCFRPIDGTRATWIEWGNVRYSKQYAEFLQTKHSYAFDYLGHLRQHWDYFKHYISASRKDVSMQKLVLSDNFAMNLFIMASTFFQCAFGFIGSLPSSLSARLKHGVDWRNATDLTALEKYQAQIEKEYSEYIDHTPFYMFPYTSKIKGLWNAIWNSPESLWVKLSSSVSAIGSSFGMLAKTFICAPIRHLYTQNGEFLEPDRVAILLYDPENTFQTGERLIAGKTYPIKVGYQTADGHKIAFVPRYKPFTELCKELASNNKVKLLEIGTQPQISVDVLYNKDEETKQVQNSELIFEMEKLQDAEKRRYATYQVSVAALAEFERAIGPDRIEYVHE
jgi:hypothetical protein